MVSTSTGLSPFAKHLVTQGLLAEAQARELTDQARADDTPLALYLENKKWIGAKELAESLARFHTLPLYDLDVHHIEKIPLEFMPLGIVQKGYAIPLLRTHGILFFGVCDPELVDISEASFATGAQVKLVIVEANKLQTLAGELREAQMVAGLENISESALNAPAEAIFSDDATADKPIVSYINQVISDAIKIKASDIHFEPFENYFRIRYRIDGMLHEVARPPMHSAGPLISRLKVLASLDIAERRVPQDGRFKMTFAQNKVIDFRMSTCPTIYGEKVVLRILNPETTPLNISGIGMDKRQAEIYLKAVHEPQGIILITGPTGSGKTVSLYTAIKLLNSIEKNICTVEDPIEIYMPGVNQVHMNTKTGLTFATAMRAFLRQDPDIIMVGEIRDLETADIAIKASQTGHLVLSTLHTNDAPSTVSRLVNIGLEPYNIASSLSLVIAQRLLRKLCKHCKKIDKISPEILLQLGFSKEEIPKLVLYKAGECAKCTHGYHGREGIFEMMSVSKTLREIIATGGDLEKLTTQAKKEGMVTLHEAGMEKVKAGLTSLEELNRVITGG
ncbi:MAG: type IV-A pilus assembly ATPase PilB [Gammaproteobacteria bacterium RIFCSPLOWO2_02_FULL_42_14]|nr:MAG: type IV-A pilus assembly ATPase PilB [Gammaproteobacteria bacterium RIFCSPHIGHO2_02_FULL_42_43]OGT27499.1 MAG: type IV-A pilus assembly ATPase PilB [Gammaproteobacteria bacterium RIFCSPHIGHO2_01_FULL_42_8]OGT51655.1 MAG: type IV-A pilus assembly ATPase PilB [Gammaproteobacteria bacterium RIFCSPHIGHO2_12_FULL_41_25]OGT61553.1 MAG: type IV-A pilus assembly ATPase PilB [Gammaproteobacteria bacterium RIFCSPLOWO2_02_FULL_42_14]OGT86176.1 MAG: type IV-A pilus assembly ATPase PilB [Gammaproteo